VYSIVALLLLASWWWMRRWARREAERRLGAWNLRTIPGAGNAVLQWGTLARSTLITW
jgi:hypothetical protein